MDVDLAACIAGDPHAWRAFVDRYAGVIVAAVRRTLGGSSDGEVDDVVQEVFVRLVDKDFRLLATYDPSRAAITTWLTLVARSAAIDRARRRKRDPVPIDSAEVAETPPNPEPAASPPEIPLHLLSGRQRLVLRLLFDDEKTVAEAAAILGVDEQTIRSTKHKALSRLRQHFSDQPESSIDRG